MCSDKTALSESTLAINAGNLTKIYHLYKQPSDRLKQLLFGRWKQYYKEFVALNDVTFQLKPGEVLGLIGRNGAGKSTLLQMICGTLTPSSGQLNIHGRIAALLELGAGFNPEFTGRENIYLSATVMGIEQQQIEKKMEHIIDFSGVAAFIDQPVKTYSSGMYVRLAFSVATSVDPDILVIDEALSVGDGDFARRSFERIMQMRDAGKTIIFCSHSLYQVEALCTEVIWLENGNVHASGKPEEIIPGYQGFLDRMDTSSTPQGEIGRFVDRPNKAEQLTKIKSTVESIPQQNTVEETHQNAHLPETQSTDAPPKPEGTGARLTKIVGTADGKSAKVLNLKSRESHLSINIEFQSYLKDEIPGVAVVVVAEGGHIVTSTGSWVTGVEPFVNEQGAGHIRVKYENFPLLKGTYFVSVLLLCNRGLFLHDEADPALTLKVTQPNKERGVAYLPHYWQSFKSTDSTTTPALHSQSIQQRWLAVDADEVAQGDLLRLFQRVFGYSMNPAVWRWKYRFADTPGAVVLENSKPVAFTGGIPRQGLVFGQPKSLVQMGDVMVAKEIRGVLTRRGPFYLVSKHYLTPRVGPDHRFSYAFGFPNERHCRLGVLTGLYNRIDLIKEPHWNNLSDQELKDSDINVSKVATDSNHYLLQIDSLWQEMARDVSNIAIGVRDRQWLKHRYIDKPGADYELYFVNRDQKILGLIVLKLHPDMSMELLDLVGSKDNAKHLIFAARKITGNTGAKDLFAWTTPTALSWLSETGEEVRDTEVVIPGCSINDPEHALKLRGKWWIIGGDSDFR